MEASSDVTAAFARHVEADASRAQFSKACAHHEHQLKQEMEADLQTMVNVLHANNTQAMQLPDRSVLYIKTKQRVAAISEERLATAVEELSGAQCRTVFRDLKAADAQGDGLVQVLSQCLAANLRKVCTKVDHAPCIVKRRPKELPSNAALMPAPPALQEVAQHYQATASQLRSVRSHKRRGARRCTDVQAETAPIIQAYMAEQNRQAQRVRLQASAPVVPPASPAQDATAAPGSPVNATAAAPGSPAHAAAAAAGLDLPALPVLLPEHEANADEPAPKRRRLAAPPDPPMDVALPPSSVASGVVTDPAAPAPVFEVRCHQARPRGSAPKLDDFVAQLPALIERTLCVADSAERVSVTKAALAQWTSDDGKRNLLQALLDGFGEMYASSRDAKQAGRSTVRVKACVS